MEELLSGPEGGDAQIAARVATGDIDVVLFFVDPLSAHPHDPAIRALLRVCNVHNVPVATNLATADRIIAALASHACDRRASDDGGPGESANVETHEDAAAGAGISCRVVVAP